MQVVVFEIQYFLHSKTSILGGWRTGQNPPLFSSFPPVPFPTLAARHRTSLLITPAKAVSEPHQDS